MVYFWNKNPQGFFAGYVGVAMLIIKLIVGFPWRPLRLKRAVANGREVKGFRLFGVFRTENVFNVYS